MKQCESLSSDRELGAWWERVFIRLALESGLLVTPYQIGRETSAACYYARGSLVQHWTLPDVVVWDAPCQHHEIKHKTTTQHGTYGLEEYRFQALLGFARRTGHRVYYTIHDHNGKRSHRPGRATFDGWRTAEVTSLNGRHQGVYRGLSWVNGSRRRVPVIYWDAGLWAPLSHLWMPYMVRGFELPSRP